MKGVVIRHYQRPYENPIAVTAGEQVTPDFDKYTDIRGWVWCAAADGRSGWTPETWLAESGGEWHVTRNFNAMELTVSPGDRLEVKLEESGFYWAQTENGRTGWVPCECVLIDKDAQS